MVTTRRTTSARDPFTEAIESAYDNLPVQEAQEIDSIAKHLIIKVKERKRGRLPPQFGYGSALELIAKLGIYMNKHKPKENQNGEEI